MDVLDSLVIGAGQVGLAASRHLVRLGVEHVVLDANPAPRGARQHRWDSLTMDDVHGVADLPDAPAPLRTPEPANVALTRTLVNATGTWTRAFVPHYPSIETFAGEQFHTATCPGPEHFVGKRVLVVGGGASAVQFLGELAPLTDVLWATRRREMFSSIEPGGVGWAHGAYDPDAIVWATGFRAALDHLAPLHLRSPSGGIALSPLSGNVQEPRRPPPTAASSSSGTALRPARSAPDGGAARPPRPSCGSSASVRSFGPRPGI